MGEVRGWWEELGANVRWWVGLETERRILGLVGWGGMGAGRRGLGMVGGVGR